MVLHLRLPEIRTKIFTKWDQSHNLLCCFSCNILFSVPPLFVIEFLHRVVDTFTEYFNSCNETSIKEHVVVVFEVRKKNLY